MSIILFIRNCENFFEDKYKEKWFVSTENIKDIDIIEYIDTNNLYNKFREIVGFSNVYTKADLESSIYDITKQDFPDFVQTFLSAFPTYNENTNMTPDYYKIHNENLFVHKPISGLGKIIKKCEDIIKAEKIGMGELIILLHKSDLKCNSGAISNKNPLFKEFKNSLNDFDLSLYAFSHSPDDPIYNFITDLKVSGEQKYCEIISKELKNFSEDYDKNRNEVIEIALKKLNIEDGTKESIEEKILELIKGSLN